MNLKQQTFLIFDLDPNGHHASYIKFLSQYISEYQPLVSLKIIVSPAYQSKHSQIISETASSKVEWIFVEKEKMIELESKKSVLRKSFFEWDLFCQFCAIYKANHAILMYFDLFQFAAILKKNPVCDFSGILFRTTLVNYKAENWKEKLNYFRKEITLRILLKNNKLKKLFCLDSFAADYIQQKWRSNKAIHLADPIQIYNNSAFNKDDFKSSLGIENDRKVFLIFGYLDSRKSISQILDALKSLNTFFSQKICLVLAGEWDNDAKLKFEATKTDKIQIIKSDTFINDENIIQSFFDSTDVVLALYQKHIGMSGILNRAALAQKPVFCYDFGLMGQLVKQYEMGVLIKNANQNDLKIAFEDFLNGKEIKLNTTKLKNFSAQNTPELFAKTIVENSLGTS